MERRAVKLEGHCAYCGGYFPNADIQDLFTEKDWEDKHKKSSCGNCYEYLDNMLDEAFRQIITDATRNLNASNSIYALAVNFNRVLVNHNPVEFYYEKKLEELNKRQEELTKTFGGKNDNK